MSAAATVLAARLHGTERMGLPMLPHCTPEERFWAKVDKHGPIPEDRPDLGPCWLWLGGLNGAGYGSFEGTVSHRWAYEHFVGPIPPGLTIDHLCDNKPCANPAHMKPATYFENSSRAVAWLREHAEATHCPHGHPYDLINTQFRRGRRYCRECERIRDSKRHDAAYWRAYRVKRKATCAAASVRCWR